MIYPGNNKLIRWFFNGYIRWTSGRNFYQVNYNQINIIPNKAILLLPNHYSWLDGFIYYHINRLLFKKKFHVMILEETIMQQRFMRHLGAFSISKNSRDMIQSLNYAAQLLHDPANLVLIFPQGKLYSNFIQQPVAESGLVRIIEQAGNNFQFVLAAGFTECLNHKKPAININLKQIDDIGGNVNISDAWQQHYSEAMARQTKIVL